MLFEVDQAEIAHTNYCRNSNPPGHFGTPEFSSCSAPLPSPNLVYSARMGENWNWNVMLGHWHGLCGLGCHIIDAPFCFGMQVLGLAGNPIARHPHCRLMALLTFGAQLQTIDGQGLLFVYYVSIFLLL